MKRFVVADIDGVWTVFDTHTNAIYGDCDTELDARDAAYFLNRDDEDWQYNNQLCEFDAY